jgi:hypothetical protein
VRAISPGLTFRDIAPCREHARHRGHHPRKRFALKAPQDQSGAAVDRRAAQLREINNLKVVAGRFF